MSKAPKTVLDLVARFDRNIEAYRSPAYKEATLRQEFVNPFFEALGWDIYNRAGYAEAYKDVIHEDAIKVGGATKAPDYCFRVGGARKFFLETKKPSVDIKKDIHPAYQLRRYAWSAKLPLSILTGFEEFAVFECRTRPKVTDKAGTGRILYLTHKEYTDRWDEIAETFSKDAVLKGSFDKFVVSGIRKRGTSEVDKEFLSEIEGWRDSLARNIALRNPDLSVRELNFAVQRVIDRIIFLRMCEDRGIEDYGQLQALMNGENTYSRLQYLFSLADDKYNSGLFHFRAERGREAPDELTPYLNIDDKVIKDMIRHLYYPESPYEFSVLGADILGIVYEQFLGKVIRLTPAHYAKVEEKPEVKKAGGVYYTPSFIVDYIVKNTVGKLCENKTPRQISKIRILDLSCGSGTFLVGALTYLLEYHRDWYVKKGPKKYTKQIYQGAGGQWYLTTQEKKRILLNNIYGVDIDSQAVEITKLNLLLKVLEGENQDTLEMQQKLFRERALPDLSNNIKCGNSLIGPDFYESGQMDLLNEEEQYRINVFDWDAEFPEIMKAGGFDAIIGNPPYIRIQVLKEWASVEVEVYKEYYSSASKGNYDIYVVFVERGLSLLNDQGHLGFILPHKFFNAKYGEPLRNLIANNKHLTHIVHFGDQQVFSGATTYTCLLFLGKTGYSKCLFSKVNDLVSWRNEGRSNEGTILSKKITSAEWNFVVGKGAALFERLNEIPLKLGDIASKIFQGLLTSSDSVYLLEPVGKAIKGKLIRVRSKATEREYDLENDVVWPLCKGSRDIRRYHAIPSKRVLFPYDPQESVLTGKTILIPEIDFKVKYPNAWAYLNENIEILRNQ